MDTKMCILSDVGALVALSCTSCFCRSCKYFVSHPRGCHSNTCLT